MDVLLGSMNMGVRGAQKSAAWRRMTAAGAAPPWASRRRGCPDTVTHVHALVKLNHQHLDILPMTTRNRKH